MRYGLSDTWSIERQLAFVTGVVAALAAKAETAELAAPWTELEAQLRAARDARDDDRDALLGAAARQRVCDVDWDEEVVDLSGRAWLAAGKDPGALPYGPLFGRVKAGDAVRLGAGKAQAFGAQLVAKARELAHPELGAAVERLARANEALGAAAAAREAAFEKTLLHDLRRLTLLRSVEALADATEVGLLTRFPGRRDLVQAVLNPPESTPRRAAEEGEPGGPDTAVSPET